MDFDDLTKKQLGLLLAAHRKARPTKQGRPLSQTATAELINEISGAKKDDAGIASQNAVSNLETKGELSDFLRPNVVLLLAKWHRQMPKVSENALKSLEALEASAKKSHLSVISDLASMIVFLSSADNTGAAKDKRLAAFARKLALEYIKVNS